MGRGSGTTVCGRCDAAWASRSARFCGRCGARLATDASPDRSSDRSSGPDGGGSRRPLVVGALAAILVIGGVVAATAGTDWLEEVGTDDRGAEGDVDLPGRDELTPGEAPETPPPGDGVRGEQELGCEPEGCELWRREVPPGQLLVTEELLVVVHRHPSPPTPAEDLESAAAEPSIEVADLVALDPATGDERWSHHLEVEGVASELDASGSSFSLAYDEALLFSLGDVVIHHDLDAPEVRWSQGFGHPVHWTARAGEHLVVGAHLDRPADDVEESLESLGIDVVLPSSVDDEGSPGEEQDPSSGGVEEPEGSWPMQGSQLLTVADAETGERRFATVSARGSAAGSNLVVVREGGTPEAVALDPTSGEEVWRRAMRVPQEEGWPQTLRIISDDRVLLEVEGGVEVVDVATGDVLGTVGQEEDLQDLQVVGNLLVWREQRSGSPLPQGQGRVVHVDRPDEPLLEVEALASVVPLASPTLSMTTGPDGSEGYALLDHEDGLAHLRVLGPDGRERWSREVEVDPDRCCAGLHPTAEGQEIIVAPVDGEVRSALRFAVEDGRSLDPIVLPDSIEGIDHVQWGSPVTTVHSAGSSQPSYVVGPDGVIEVQAVHPLLPSTRDGIPVVLVGDQLLVLDPRPLGLPEPGTVTGDE